MNCHQNTEAADLLGGLRPLRGRDRLAEELRERAKEFLRRCSVAIRRLSHGVAVEGDLVDGDVGSGAASPVVQKMSVDGLQTVIQVRRCYYDTIPLAHPDGKYWKGEFFGLRL